MVGWLMLSEAAAKLALAITRNGINTLVQGKVNIHTAFLLRHGCVPVCACGVGFAGTVPVQTIHCHPF